MRLIAVSAFLYAALVAAAPMPQDQEPGAVFGISFTFENGTFTDVHDVPETLSGYPLGKACLNRVSRPDRHRPADLVRTCSTASNGIVTNVFIYPPAGQPARCAFLEPEPSRQGLGAWTIARATTVVLDPPAEVGYVQCNRA
ncbi:hypothetical protein LY76DRAFT_597705 [Colletotrichum caudatum]|nr:hypothetical protein LY76DRAFT_597705 [Colletotrichum caudatum]